MTARPSPVRTPLRYHPCVGVWPVVVALAVAIPLAILARRDAQAPSIVVCSTQRVEGAKLCSKQDAHSVGSVEPIACSETPDALETYLHPSNPFAIPIVRATQIKSPKRSAGPGVPGCSQPAGFLDTPAEGTVVLGPGVKVPGDASAVSGPASTPASKPAFDGSDGIDANTARGLVRECATHPDWSGAVHMVTVTVLERDYLRSALVLAGFLALALGSMARRRVRLLVDRPAGILSVVERGWFRVRRRLQVPLPDIELVKVATGAGGLLNGKRVELLCRGGAIVPLVDAFVPLTWRVHEQTSARLAHELGAVPVAVDAPSRGAIAVVALASLATVGAALMGVVAWHRWLPSKAHPSARAVLARVGAVRDGSTVLLATYGDRRLAILADEQLGAVRIVEAPAMSRPTEEPAHDLFTVKLDTPPGPMVMDRAGRLYVAMPRESAVLVFAPAASGPGLARIGRIDTDAEPTALSLSPGDDQLVVVADYGHALETFRLGTLAKNLEVDLPRSPRALTLSADGTRAYVTHDVGSHLSTVDLRSGAAFESSLDGGKGPRPSPLLQARVARIKDELFVPGVFAATGDPNRPPPRATYYGDTQALSGFSIWQVPLGGSDEKALSERLGARGTVIGNQFIPRSGEPPRAGLQPPGCLLPRVALADPAGQWLYVACEGPGRVFRIDVGPRARTLCDGAWMGGYEVGDGPTGMVFDEDERTLLVWSPWAERLTTLPLNPVLSPGRTGFEASAVTIEPPAEWVTTLSAPRRDVQATLLAHGRHLFYSTNNPAISGDNAACASCHIDGRDDGLTWPTELGPRQTPMLAGRIVGTAPYGWSGRHGTLQEHLVETFTRLNATQTLPATDEGALIAYIQSLPPPHFGAGDVESVARGRAVFLSAAAGCSGCHSPGDGTFTDAERHDVHSRARGDHLGAFDTPSLLDVGATAPYFHDGRYATLADLLDKTDGSMGHTRQLTPQDKTDLVHYLESIGATDGDSSRKGEDNG